MAAAPDDNIDAERSETHEAELAVSMACDEKDSMHQRRKGFQDHLSWHLGLLRISACVGQSDSTDVIGVLAQMCLNIISVQLNRLLQSVRRILSRIGVDQPIGGY